MLPIASQSNRGRIISMVINGILRLSLCVLLQYLQSTRSVSSGKLLLIFFFFQLDLLLLLIPSRSSNPAISVFADPLFSTPSPTSPFLYPCLYSNCCYISSRAYDLERHMTIHFLLSPEELLDCKYEWCGRTGVQAYTASREKITARSIIIRSI